MKNNIALIGHTGFIGSNLIKFKKNLDKFNSKNIAKITNKNYDIVICAGTSSKMWMANKYPKKDKKNINNLIKHLKKLKTNKFVLISTCEVFANYKKNYEKIYKYPKTKNNYALNRIYLEKFCRKQFQINHIVRLPIVYGNNFIKNCIYDLLNKKNINLLNGKDQVQIYNVKNLIKHIKYVLSKNIEELNISSPPINLGLISQEFFNIRLKEKKPFRKMNMKSNYSKNKSEYFIDHHSTKKDLRDFIKKY